MMIPGIVSVSQMGTGAYKYKSDCGPACAVGVLHAMKGISMDPDDFYDFMEVANDSGTSTRQLRDFMAIFECPTSAFSSAGMDMLERYVNEQRLAIWLIWYKPLSDAGCVQYKGTFYHWVICVGCDEKFIYINDPYRTDGRSYIPVPRTAWHAASCATGLVTKESVPGGSDMADATHRVASGLGGLNVRSGPGVSYAVLGSLTRSEEVTVTSVAADWARIEGPRLYGYSYFPYLETIPSTTIGVVTVYYTIEKPDGVTVNIVQRNE